MFKIKNENKPEMTEGNFYELYDVICEQDDIYYEYTTELERQNTPENFYVKNYHY